MSACIKQLVAEHGLFLRGVGGQRLRLGGEDLSCTALDHVDLSEVDLANCRLSCAHLTACTLYGADLRGVYWRAGTMSRCDARLINLRGANLHLWLATSSDLTGACLESADLCRAILNGSNLTEVHAAGASLRGAYLKGAILRGADLTGCDLTLADLRLADLRGATLTGADFTSADMRGAILDKDIPAHLRMGVRTNDAIVLSHLVNKG